VFKTFVGNCQEKIKRTNSPAFSTIVNNSLLLAWGGALVGCEIACSVAVAFTRVLSELSSGRLAQSTGGLTQSRGRDKPRRATENSSVFVSVAWVRGPLARTEWSTLTFRDKTPIYEE
jgi:hypothetical protein